MGASVLMRMNMHQMNHQDPVTDDPSMYSLNGTGPIIRRSTLDAMSDQELLRHVADGNGDSRRVLVERYREYFGKLARALCGDDDRATEAMYDAFVVGFQEGPSENIDNFDTWLFRLLTARCHKLRRPAAWRSTLLAARLGTIMQAGADPEYVRDSVDSALDALTAEEREVVVLKHVGRMDATEAAGLLGRSADTVRSIGARAERKLVRYVRMAALAAGGDDQPGSIWLRDRLEAAFEVYRSSLPGPTNGLTGLVMDGIANQS